MRVVFPSMVKTSNERKDFLLLAEKKVTIFESKHLHFSPLSLLICFFGPFCVHAVLRYLPACHPLLLCSNKKSFICDKTVISRALGAAIRTESSCSYLRTFAVPTKLYRILYKSNCYLTDLSMDFKI